MKKLFLALLVFGLSFGASAQDTTGTHHMATHMHKTRPKHKHNANTHHMRSNNTMRRDTTSSTMSNKNWSKSTHRGTHRMHADSTK